DRAAAGPVRQRPATRQAGRQVDCDQRLSVIGVPVQQGRLPAGDVGGPEPRNGFGSNVSHANESERSHEMCPQRWVRRAQSTLAKPVRDMLEGPFSILLPTWYWDASQTEPETAK